MEDLSIPSVHGCSDVGVRPDVVDSVVRRNYNLLRANAYNIALGLRRESVVMPPLLQIVREKLVTALHLIYDDNVLALIASPPLMEPFQESARILHLGARRLAGTGRPPYPLVLQLAF